MKQLLILIAAMFLLGACGGGNDSNPSPSTPPAQVEFSEFVIDEINNQTEEDNEPAEVNDIDFSFNEDETAFDSLLQ